MEGDYQWAGVTFTAIYHHDLRMFRAPGLYAYVKRLSEKQRSILYVDQADSIGRFGYLSERWAEAASLGMNEVHICLSAKEQIDRLILKAHIIKRELPLLNVLQDDQSLDQSLLKRHQG